MGAWDFDFECGTCGKAFAAGRQARDKHCNALGHHRPAFECDTCPRILRSERARYQHARDLNHFASQCSLCDQTHPTPEGQTTHEHEDHLYCGDCNRCFQSYHNLKQHLHSRAHIGDAITCPFCARGFTTAAGLALEVVREACAEARHLNRQTVYERVRAKDPGGMITKHLIGWRDENCIYTASNASWNGNAWECYLCRREFDRLTGLNQHLNSAAHKQNLYHCPQSTCRADFKTLAAFLNHLESETCGYARFDHVQRQMEGLVSSTRRLAL